MAEEGKSGAVSAPLTAFFGKKKDWKREFQPNRPVKEPEKADEIHLQAAEAAVLPMRPRAEAARKAEIAKKTEKTEKTEPTAKQPEERTAVMEIFQGFWQNSGRNCRNWKKRAY